MHTMQRNYAFLTLLLMLAVLMGSLGGVSSSARKSGADEPASGGRPITPAGSLVQDVSTRQPAVGSLPVDFVRSPDQMGPDGGGRYLIAVNSGFGIQFNAAGNRGQQSLGVIDLNAKPNPVVIQNVYFPSPQSVNVGVVFAPKPDEDGSYALYVSGGFENKIWIFRFHGSSRTPISPASPGPNTHIAAPFIDVSGFASAANSPRYNSNHAPVYPTGVSISQDGNTLFVANNLGDSLGIVSDLRGQRKLERIDLTGRSGQAKQDEEHFTYPYAVVAIPIGPGFGRQQLSSGPLRSTSKAYVSCWNDASVAVIDLSSAQRRVSYIPVGRHPTAMIWDGTQSRLYVVNSDDDSVSMIDTRYDREVERIIVRLAETSLSGNSNEGLALNESGSSLFVANAHSNSIAVVSLAKSLDNSGTSDQPAHATRRKDDISHVQGFIPTGQYPSAVAVVG